MNIYEYLHNEQEQKRRENEFKKASLEKQLKTWKKRQDELRNIGNTAIDPAFLRRQLDRCSNEIARINQLLSNL